MLKSIPSVIAFCLFYTFSYSLTAQRITVSGYVSDGDSGERLPGVSLYEANTRQHVYSNNYGFFSLKTQKGSRNLYVNYVGYEADTLQFVALRDTVIDIRLSGTILKEVVIQAENPLLEVQPGIVHLPVRELKTRPVLFGEPDIIKALMLTPGVKSGTEGTTGLYVRGGTPDQNLILLDGATVYNNSHLFGFVSVFNPDVMQSVTLYKGQMPGRYGGRLSSVLDVTMKEGNNRQRTSELSAGIIGSRFFTEGPLRKGKSSYLFSARSSYLGLLALPSYIGYKNGNNSNYANYWMYDWNGKINLSTGKNSRLYVSFYQGQDDWRAYSKQTIGNSTFGLQWGNQTVSLRYTNLLKDRFFWTVQQTFNRYRYAVEEGSKAEQEVRNRSASFVQDMTHKNTLQWAFAKRHLMEGGVEITRQNLHPLRITTEYNGQPVPTSDLSSRSEGWVSAVFLEDQIEVSSAIRLSAGMRGALFSTGGAIYRFAEPRTRILLRLSATSNLELSWRKNYQPLHLLTSTSAGLPNDIWVPATANIPPANSHQWSAGWTKKLPRFFAVLTVEAYYKEMNNLLDFRQGLNFFDTDTPWEEIVEKNGLGKSYGLECMAHKQQGRWNGWISYTFAFNKRRFENINGNRWYPHQYDRRHEFSSTGNYTFSDRWSAAANFVFASGNAFTAPSYIAVNYYDGKDVAQYVPVYLGKNNRRGPVYHRLDVSLTRKHTGKRGRSVEWSFGVYNLYANNNPFYLDVSVVSLPNADFLSFDRALFKYKVGSVFNFIPSVSYAVSFK